MLKIDRSVLKVHEMSISTSLSFFNNHKTLHANKNSLSESEHKKIDNK